MVVADVNVGFRKGKLYASKADHTLVMVLQSEDEEGKRSNLIVTLDAAAQDKLKKVL